jgi:hypothetical protein
MSKEKIQTLIQRREVMDKFIEGLSIKDVATCPCCGFPTLSDHAAYEICAVCNWEDDGQDNDNADEIVGGPNGTLSLTQARIDFIELLESLENRSGKKMTTDPRLILDVLSASGGKRNQELLSSLFQ